MSDDAILRYEKEMADDPQSRAFAPLAEAYRKAGRLDEAISVAKAGLEIHPGYSAGLVVLGRAHYEKGELDNAAEILKSAVGDNPENYLGQKFLGKVLMDKGENVGAMKALEAANFISPEDEEVARLLSEVKSKASPPETMNYETREAEAQAEAQIVTYEQKPTTIDGIELPPLPGDLAEDSFSFSGGGTVDPADITPVPVEEELEPQETAGSGITAEDAEDEDLTATVVDEEEVEQTMEIGSIDELGPEVAAFIQEGEEVSVRSIDEPLDDLPDDGDEEFVIEAEGAPPIVSSDEPALDAEFEIEPAVAPEPVRVPEPEATAPTAPADGHVSVPAPEQSFELLSEPTAAPNLGTEATAPHPPETAPSPEIEPAVAPEPAKVPEPEVMTPAAPAAGPTPVPAPERSSEPLPEPARAEEQSSELAPAPAPVPESAGPPSSATVPAPGPAPDTPQGSIPGSGPAQASQPQVPAQAPSEPPREAQTAQEQFSTETLADLYAQQGLTDKAVGMYRQILGQDPGNEAVRLKLDALGIKATNGPGSAQAEKPGGPPPGDVSSGTDAEDTLRVLEGLLAKVERIKKHDL